MLVASEATSTHPDFVGKDARIRQIKGGDFQSAEHHFLATTCSGEVSKCPQIVPHSHTTPTPPAIANLVTGISRSVLQSDSAVSSGSGRIPATSGHLDIVHQSKNVPAISDITSGLMVNCKVSKFRILGFSRSQNPLFEELQTKLGQSTWIIVFLMQKRFKQSCHHPILLRSILRAK
ncbi:hypothetical protein DM860_001152 [Cuscuta australis]|uniref:Uncharacterized protein n=1 Tax=Cuscuta australis TaxID=267555 RepID=A0A328DT55_9ASTE|nr:hypothetical protein DM860_001152 [Cuscuta australis]